MKMLTNYFLLEGKRSLFVLKKSIVSLVCVVVALLVVVIGMLQLYTKTNVFPKIEVGIVAEGDNWMIDYAKGYLAGLESVENICHIHYVDYEQGERMLSEGELQVVVVLPASLYDELNNLQPTQAKILLPEEESLGVRMFGELLASAINLLQVGEAGVSATYDVSTGEVLNISRGDLGSFLALKYAFQALDRMDTYDAEVVSPMGTMDQVQFYFLALFLCVCMVCGLNFSYLYEKKQKALESKLCIEGVGKVKQTFVKLLLMAGYVFFTELLIYLGGCIISKALGLSIVEFGIAGIVVLALLAVLLAVHFHFIYAVAKDEKQGMLLLLVSSMIFTVCAGLFVPQVYLPQAAQWVGNLSPVYGWSMLAQQALYNQSGLIALGHVAAWFVAEFGIGVYCSWKNA